MKIFKNAKAEIGKLIKMSTEIDKVTPLIFEGEEVVSHLQRGRIASRVAGAFLRKAARLGHRRVASEYEPTTDSRRTANRFSTATL